jgi:hypothetical protein
MKTIIATLLIVLGLTASAFAGYYVTNVGDVQYVNGTGDDYGDNHVITSVGDITYIN